MNDPDPLSILAAFGAAEAPDAVPALGGITLAIAGFILFLLLNAFFVAAEFALMKVRESQLHAGDGVPRVPVGSWPGHGRRSSTLTCIWPPARRALPFLLWRWDFWARFSWRS